MPIPHAWLGNRSFAPVRHFASVALLVANAIGFADEGSETIRIATYNASLFGDRAGEIRRRLGDGKDRQAENLLPSRDLELTGSGVFWPNAGQPGHEWIDASDHRLVWIDVRLPSAARP